MFPAVEGRVLTAGPPGKSPFLWAHSPMTPRTHVSRPSSMPTHTDPTAPCSLLLLPTRPRTDGCSPTPTPTSRPHTYLEVGVDGRDLGGAAGGHTGLDDLDRRVGGGLLQGCGSCVCLSVARQPAGTAAHLQGVWEGQAET